jgi:hypothetical protein
MWPGSKHKPKTSRGEREDSTFSPFVLTLVGAGVALLCLLLYVLLSPVLSGDDKPEYQIVPYGGDLTATPAVTFPVPTLTALPLPTIAPTPASACGARAGHVKSSRPVTPAWRSARRCPAPRRVSGIAFSRTARRIAAAARMGPCASGIPPPAA